MDSLGSWTEGASSGVLENSKGAGIRILLSESSEGMRLSGIGRLLRGKRGDGATLWTLLGLIWSETSDAWVLSGRPADGCGELDCVALPGGRGMITEGDLARRLSGPREWGETGDWVRIGN